MNKQNTRNLLAHHVPSSCLSHNTRGLGWAFSFHFCWMRKLSFLLSFASSVFGSQQRTWKAINHETGKININQPEPRMHKSRKGKLRNKKLYDVSSSLRRIFAVRISAKVLNNDIYSPAKSCVLIKWDLFFSSSLFRRWIYDHRQPQLEPNCSTSSEETQVNSSLSFSWQRNAHYLMV